MRRRGLDILAALRVEEPDRNDGGNDDDSDYDDGGDKNGQYTAHRAVVRSVSSYCMVLHCIA